MVTKTKKTGTRQHVIIDRLELNAGNAPQIGYINIPLNFTDANQTEILASNEYNNKVIRFTGTVNTAGYIRVPNDAGAFWTFRNDVDGSVPLYAKTIGQSDGYAVLIPNGGSLSCYVSFDGTSTYNVCASTTVAATQTTSTGNYASRPAAGNAGNIYICDDIGFSYYDDGVNWIQIFKGIYTESPGDISLWTWHNQGSATKTNVGDSIDFQGYSEGASYNIHSLLQDLPSSSNWTVTIGLVMYPDPITSSSQVPMAGICLRRNAVGANENKEILWGLSIVNDGYVSQPYLSRRKMTDATTSNSVTENSTWLNQIMWLKIVDDGVDLNYYYSYDKSIWQLYLTEARAEFCIPDQWGFFIQNYSSTSRALIFDASVI